MECPSPTVKTVSPTEAKLRGSDTAEKPHNKAGTSIRYSQPVFSQAGTSRSPSATLAVGLNKGKESGIGFGIP
jgi:hypothetical protein